MLARPTHARPGPAGEQTIEVIVDRGYRPDVIVARAGVPLRIVFRRRDADACLDRVVFSSPRIERRLAMGATTVYLPGQPPGEVRFTCGMGRYHGQISMRAAARSPVAGLRLTLLRHLMPVWRLARGQRERKAPEDAVDTLRVRFARGELSLEEFEQRCRLALRNEGMPVIGVQPPSGD